MTFFFGIRSSRRIKRIFLFFDAFSLAFLLSAFMPSLAIQICLATPSLKNARQFVNGIFPARTREGKRNDSASYIPNDWAQFSLCSLLAHVPSSDQTYRLN